MSKAQVWFLEQPSELRSVKTEPITHFDVF